MSVQTDDIIEVKLSNSSLAQLSKAFQGSLGTSGGGGKQGIAGMTNIMSMGLAKLGLITTGISGIYGLIKSIVASSPMLQQMLKLLQFSVMLILRPIGDFIGFFLRPILLWALRTYIIPFYQTYMPIAIALGEFLGTKMVGGFSQAAETAEKAATYSWEEDPITKALLNLQSNAEAWGAIWNTTFSFFGDEKTGQKVQTDISNFFASITNAGAWFETNLKTFDWSILGQHIADKFKSALDALAMPLTWIVTYIKQWFRLAINDLTTSISFIWDYINTWFSDSIGNLTTSVSFVWTLIYNWFFNSINNLTVSVSKLWDIIIEWIQKTLNSFIPKPETFFEETSKTVNQGFQDFGKGASSFVNDVVINIDKFTSDNEDLRKLKQTITDVLQELNGRNGKG